MNEKIKELAEFHNINENVMQAIYDDLMPSIVQECSKVILEWKKEPFPFDEDTAVELIHKHFGLKLPPKNIRVIKI